jgi:diguanylate cyclase
LQDGETLADQIRRTMMQRRIVQRSTGEKYGTITLSLGVSCYRPGESLADFVRRADDALYQAKRGGRNRVVTEALVAPLVVVSG